MRQEQRIFFLGVGKLGGQILDLLLRLPGKYRFLIGGRNLLLLRQRVNLSIMAAIQLGFFPEVECVPLDLDDVEQTAESIAHFQPDLIFCAATRQPPGGTQGLPPALAQQLAQAPMAPRLPLSLSLVYKLMQAVRLAGNQHATKVINAIFPDMIHPILQQVNLAPTTGIGDLANNIPAVRLAAARTLNVPLLQVDVSLVMAHWVSYWMSRTDVTNAPYHLAVFVNGENCTQLVKSGDIFRQLPTTLKRAGGETGLLMTAASAAVVCRALLCKQPTFTHVPGPNGLPGGYPAEVHAQGVDVKLPPDITLETAEQTNKAGLRLDGIEQIETNGTVIFTDEAVMSYKKLLGYECLYLPLIEVEERAQELKMRYERAKV
jgi:hypothetical protein